MAKVNGISQTFAKWGGTLCFMPFFLAYEMFQSNTLLSDCREKLYIYKLHKNVWKNSKELQWKIDKVAIMPEMSSSLSIVETRLINSYD